MKKSDAEQIHLPTLRSAILRLFDHIIEDIGVETVELNQDYYWEIGAKALFDMSRDPTRADMVIGSLYDDWEIFSKLAKEDEDPVALQLGQLWPLVLHIGEVLKDEFAIEEDKS